MKSLGNSILINRGETFTLSRNVLNDFGEPYILSKYWQNPHLLITVSSNLYHVRNRYIKHYWLDLSDYPSFENTVAEFIEDLGGDLPDGYNADTSVFYTIDESGDKEFWYWDGSEFKPYQFVFHKTFYHSDTVTWVESFYNYEIRLVSGTSMNYYLTNEFMRLYPEATPPEDNATLWLEIAKVEPSLVKDIVYTAALVNYNVNDILLRPSKIIVKTTI